MRHTFRLTARRRNPPEVHLGCRPTAPHEVDPLSVRRPDWVMAVSVWVWIHEDALRAGASAISDEHGVTRDRALVIDNSGLIRRPGNSDHVCIRLIQKRAWLPAH